MSNFNSSSQQYNNYSTWNNNNNNNNSPYRGRGNFQGRGRGRGRGRGQSYYKPTFTHQLKDDNIIEVDYSPTALEQKYSSYYSPVMLQDPWKDLPL